eukprot:585487-Prorocentrum_minimum.AAC.1
MEDAVDAGRARVHHVQLLHPAHDNAVLLSRAPVRGSALLVAQPRNVSSDSISQGPLAEMSREPRAESRPSQVAASRQRQVAASRQRQ